MYSYKVEQAVKAASLLHQDHVRHGPVALPHLSHLISVYLILNDYTDDEDTLVAALLHDTLEDTDYTPEELREDFGESVAEIVETLTEPKYKGKKKLTLLEWKAEYVKQLKNGSEKALMVAAADKIHNFRCMVEDFYGHPDKFVWQFGSNVNGRLEAYQNMANVINSRLKSDLVHEFNHTFNELKQFLLDVEKSQNKVH